MTPALPPTLTPSATRPPLKRQVREKGAVQPLTALQLPADQPLTLASGRAVRGRAGDWVISRGGAVVDVIADKSFEREYEDIPQGTLTILPNDLAALAQQLGPQTVDSSADLTRAVLKLATLSIGSIAVQFTVAQWEELHRRAEKRGQSIDRYLQQLVQKLCQDLWTAAI